MALRPAEQELDVAVQLAESATVALPTQAEFYDTLGWYYKNRFPRWRSDP